MAATVGAGAVIISAAIEAEVNAEIRANEPVVTRLMSPDEAIEAGAMALFGEKYGDEVRVLSMGRTTDKTYSVELCGGTHVRALGDIGVFRIISESAVSSGVRRIEALTGEGARQWLVGREDALKGAASLLRTTPDDVEARVVGDDPRSDVALIKLEGKNPAGGVWPHLPLGNSEALAVGDFVVAIGNRTKSKSVGSQVQTES